MADLQIGLGVAIVLAAFSPVLAYLIIDLLHRTEPRKDHIVDPNPRYHHDCEHCTYLGTWWRASLNTYYDLYVCPPRSDWYRGPCLLARFSDTPDDYYSHGLPNWEDKPSFLLPPLQEAFYRARVLEYL